MARSCESEDRQCLEMSASDGRESGRMGEWVSVSYMAQASSGRSLSPAGTTRPSERPSARRRSPDRVRE